MGFISRRFYRCDNTEGQRFILRISLAEPEGDFGAGRLDAQIECVTDVLPRIDFWKEFERIIGYVVPIAIVDVDAILGHLYPIVWISHFGSQGCNIF